MVLRIGKGCIQEQNWKLQSCEQCIKWGKRYEVPPEKEQEEAQRWFDYHQEVIDSIWLYNGKKNAEEYIRTHPEFQKGYYTMEMAKEVVEYYKNLVVEYEEKCEKLLEGKQDWMDEEWLERASKVERLSKDFPACPAWTDREVHFGCIV